MNWEYKGKESDLFHDRGSLTWSIATLLALARRTGRIFVMPRIQADHGVHFLWTILDFESVEEVGVDYRETTFPTNPKAWINETVFFQSVARTALGNWDHDKTMFAQYPAADPNNDGVIKAWKFNEPVQSVAAVDIWWAMHTAVPEIDNAELLLVNPHFYNASVATEMNTKKKSNQLTGAEKEIAEIHSRLRWCFDLAIVVYENIVGRTNPDYNCHGRGKPWG